METFAGDCNVSGYDDGRATLAKFGTLSDLVADRHGNVFILDKTNHAIRMYVAATGNVTTLAGGKSECEPGDDKFHEGLGYVVYNEANCSLLVLDNWKKQIWEVRLPGNCSDAAADDKAGDNDGWNNTGWANIVLECAKWGGAALLGSLLTLLAMRPGGVRNVFFIPVIIVRDVGVLLTRTLYNGAHTFQHLISSIGGSFSSASSTISTTSTTTPTPTLTPADDEHHPPIPRGDIGTITAQPNTPSFGILQAFTAPLNKWWREGEKEGVEQPSLIDLDAEVPEMHAAQLPHVEFPEGQSSVDGISGHSWGNFEEVGSVSGGGEKLEIREEEEEGALEVNMRMERGLGGAHFDLVTGAEYVSKAEEGIGASTHRSIAFVDEKDLEKWVRKL